MTPGPECAPIRVGRRCGASRLCGAMLLRGLAVLVLLGHTGTSGAVVLFSVGTSGSRHRALADYLRGGASDTESGSEYRQGDMSSRRHERITRRSGVVTDALRVQTRSDKDLQRKRRYNFRDHSCAQIPSSAHASSAPPDADQEPAGGGGGCGGGRNMPGSKRLELLASASSAAAGGVWNCAGWRLHLDALLP